MRNLNQLEFFEVETFKNKQGFLNKAYSYQLYFNLKRPNSYEENETSWQIAKEKEPGLSIEVANIKPVILDDLLAVKMYKKRMDFLAEGGYDVYSVPSFL